LLYEVGVHRYPYFSSIEPTQQSEKIGKYLFITTQDKFEAAKNWINTELPQIWAALDHNFLDELPDSVQCPRLTTSNLKDATTSKTVAMLNASKVPDDATIASKWSMPPQIGRNRNPPNTITVNYTPSHFPPLPKQNPRQGKESKETQPLDPSTFREYGTPIKRKI
jgi:hypothetical protein